MARGDMATKSPTSKQDGSPRQQPHQPHSEKQARPVKVLVVGSGYIAQHLIAAMARDPSLHVSYSHRRATAPFEVPAVRAVRLDVTDARSCVEALWATTPDVVINAAAVSSPRQCEAEPEVAAATNNPAEFLEALFAVTPDAMLVHFSTDIVLADRADAAPGTTPPHGDAGDCSSALFPKQDDDSQATSSSTRRPPTMPAFLASSNTARPVNVYGRTKLAFEKRLFESKFARCVVLRASNVVGPPAPYDGSGKFAQWLETEIMRTSSDTEATNNSPVKLWHDEVRSFVDVRQLVSGVKNLVARYARPYDPVSAPDRLDALKKAAARPSETAFYEQEARRAYPPFFLHLNAGGPQPLSRLDLGRLVADALGVDADLAVSPVSRASASLGYPSPLDVAMDSSNFCRFTGTRLIPIKDALAHAVGRREQHEESQSSSSR